MTKNKLPMLLMIIAFLSLFFFVTLVWADNENNGHGNDSDNGQLLRAITIQDKSTFLGKHQGNEISNTHSANTETEICAFLTNQGQEQLRSTNSVTDLTLLLQNSDGQQIGEPYHIVINSGESSGHTTIIFPENGQYQLYASGIIYNDGHDEENGNDGHDNGNSGNGNGKSEEVSYTTNLFWVGIVQNVDHFGFVDSSGSVITNPNLKLRSDANLSSSTWSYIGEPMLLDVYLKAYTKDGTPINDYIWGVGDVGDYKWFEDPDRWNIVPNKSSITTSVLSVSEEDSILNAIIEIRVSDKNLEQVIRDFSISVKPMDRSGISTPEASPAVVPNHGTTFTLYGGQIRVAPGYFYQEDGKAQVYVEKYDDYLKKFVLNKDDSQTFARLWNLSGETKLTPDFKFQEGSGEVPVHSDTSNVTKTLRPSSYPSYLGVVEGTLTWGQIVDNPPPKDPLQHDNGPVWERELLP